MLEGEEAGALHEHAQAYHQQVVCAMQFRSLWCLYMMAASGPRPQTACRLIRPHTRLRLDAAFVVVLTHARRHPGYRSDDLAAISKVTDMVIGLSPYLHRLYRRPP